MAVRKNLRRQDKDAEQERVTVQERPVSQERSVLGEGMGVLCVTLTIFLGLAFFSYQPEAANSNQVGRAGHLDCPCCVPSTRPDGVSLPGALAIRHGPPLSLAALYRPSRPG